MNILLSTLGVSWAVVPEAYGFLESELSLYKNHPQIRELKQTRAQHGLLAPDEIWVCTTEGRKTHNSIRALTRWWEIAGKPIPLRIWTAAGTDQLASQAECELFRELIFRLALLGWARCAGGQLNFSLAGGRKTMSADLQRAASLFGAYRLLHIVDAGELPEPLRYPEPSLLAAPIPTHMLCSAEGTPQLIPLVVGSGHRAELLDIDTRDFPPVRTGAYPIPLPESGDICSWAPVAGGSRLFSEVDRRESEGASLLGNYLATIIDREHHENWRQLYRLPSELINRLRSTRFSSEHRQWLASLPQADLHRHLGGCLDLPSQRRVAAYVWDETPLQERGKLLDRVQPLLSNDSRWEWAWPDLLKSMGEQSPMLRSLCVAALFSEIDDERLIEQLWGATEPRLGLARENPRGFAAYERPGELTGSAILQHPAAVGPYAEAVLQQALEENLAYVELRGSPQKYLGGDGAAFIKAFSAEIRKARFRRHLNDDDSPVLRFIIIVDRRGSETQVRQAVDLAVSAQREGFVVGLDLAGEERQDPERMAEWFLPAFRACLPITIHAGEGQSADRIWHAAYHLHADRIGHGLTLHEQPQLLRRFRDRGICLELCPTSNREVVGFRDPRYPASQNYPAYPLRDLWDQGVSLCINTDNPGISRTSLCDEFLAANLMIDKPFSLWEVLSLNKQAFASAFISSEDREKLLKRVDRAIYKKLLESFPS